MVEAALNPLNTFGSVKRWFGRTFAEATLRREIGCHWELVRKKMYLFIEDDSWDYMFWFIMLIHDIYIYTCIYIYMYTYRYIYHTYIYIFNIMIFYRDYEHRFADDDYPLVMSVLWKPWPPNSDSRWSLMRGRFPITWLTKMGRRGTEISAQS